MPFLFPFREIGQPLHAGFRRFLLSAFSLLSENSRVIRFSVLSNLPQDVSAAFLIVLAVIVPLVAGLLAFGPLAIGNLSEASALSLTPDPLACSTQTLSLADSLFRNRILGRVFMASDAKPLSCSVPSGYILAKRARLKMIRVYAFRDAAEMIQRETLRNGAAGQLPGETMGHVFLATIGQMAVSEFVRHTNPKPACGGFENPLPEGLIDGVGTHRIQYAASISSSKYDGTS